MPLPDDALDHLSALTGVVLRHDNIFEALDEICRIAVRGVPNAEGASLTMFSESGPQAAAASDDWARHLDETQFEEREGPCLDAARSGFVFRIRDSLAETRWPSYMPRVSEQGIRSVMSIPLANESKVIGGLNLYSSKVDAFTAEHVSLAEIIAGHASLASQVASSLHAHKELADQLRQAMTSRAVIEQAKGVIMATRRCSPDEAFAVLAKQSQFENRKLRDIAEEIVRHHTS